MSDYCSFKLFPVMFFLNYIHCGVCTTAFIPQNIGWPSNDNTNTPTVLQKVSYMAERVVGTGSFVVVYQVC